MFLKSAIFATLVIVLCWGAAARADSPLWYFSPRMALQQQYTDNLNISENGEEDWVSQMEGGFTSAGVTERGEARINATAKRFQYVYNTQLDRTDVMASGSVSWRWTPTFMTTFGGSYLQDSTLEEEYEETGNITQRAKRNILGMTGSGVLRLSERLQVELSGGLNYVRYPDGERTEYDRWNVAINPAYLLDEYNTVGISAIYSSLDYEPRVFTFFYQRLTDKTSTDNISSSLYWTHKVDETCDFRIQGGYSISHTREELITEIPIFNYRVSRTSESDSDGFIYSASISKRWNDRVSSSLKAGRQHVLGSDSEVDLRTYVATNHDFRLTEKTRWNLGLRYDLNEEEETEDNQNAETKQTAQVSSSLRWEFIEDYDLFVNTSYTHVLSETDSRDTDYSRFVMTIGVEMVWPSLFDNN